MRRKTERKTGREDILTSLSMVHHHPFFHHPFSLHPTLLDISYMLVHVRVYTYCIHVNNIIYIYIISYRIYICNIPILYIKNRAEATKRENERLSMERCYCVALSSCVGQRSLGRQLMGVGSRGPPFFSPGFVGYRGNRGIRQCRQRTPSGFFH